MFARLWSLLRLVLVWRIKPDYSQMISIREANCIIVLAFGQEVVGSPPDDAITPGPANEALARALVQYLRRSINEDLPVLAQWEVAETIYLRREKRISVTPLGHRYNYRNTREIIQEAKEIMDSHGWSRAVIVAHPWHMARCLWAAQRIGIETVVPNPIIHEVNHYALVWNRSVDVPEDQKQTTSLSRWLIYELAARGYFWLKGWI